MRDVKGQLGALLNSSAVGKDHDLIEFLRQAGIDQTDAEAMVDGNSPEIAWQEAPAHHYEPA
ncbi:MULTISPECIES: hypothetical protein [unclassified Streptomyces]|uniref:hypothetical protein n=1 Tax=unclassified Streptomyces TaxID=2593676 RepID=UPI00381C1EAD